MKSSSRSFKWIFFRIINYIQIVVSFFVIVFATIGSWPLRFPGIIEFLFFLVPMIMFSIFIGNSLSNLYLVEKFYPDQLPPKAASRFNLTMYVLMIIVSSLLTLAGIGGLYQTINSEVSDVAFSAIALVIVGILVITSIPIWFLQGNLRSTLKRNYYANFDQFLENDEVPESENE